MNRFVAGYAFTLAVALLALGPSPAEAQHVSFGFSTGHRHHHGHHWHGPCWGPSRSWFGVVLAPPPPVIHERVIYVEPPPRVTTIVTGSAPLAATSTWTPPVASALPVNAVSSTPVAAAGDARITIRNAAGAKLPVAFLIDGQEIELADGELRSFVGRDRRSVQYDRGGHFGATQHDLAAGDYDFRITASGWDLVRRAGASERTAVRPNALPAR